MPIKNFFYDLMVHKLHCSFIFFLSNIVVSYVWLKMSQMMIGENVLLELKCKSMGEIKNEKKKDPNNEVPFLEHPFGYGFTAAAVWRSI